MDQSFNKHRATNECALIMHESDIHFITNLSKQDGRQITTEAFAPLNQGA